MDILKAAPESLARYADFLLTFSHSPSAAVTPLLATGTDAVPKISPALLMFAALGVGLAYAIVMIGGAIGMAPDTSPILGPIDRIGKEWMPVVAVIAIFAVSLSWHVLGRLVSVLFGGIVSDAHFGGAVQNSINAGLALGAFYIPASILLVIAMRVGALYQTPPLRIQMVAFLVLTILLTLGFIGHAVLTFAAAHSLSVARAVVLFFLACIPLAPLLKVIR